MEKNPLFIPLLFYGTAWKKQKTSQLVEMALKAGFKAIDTACQPKHYNEKGVGQGIIKSGLPRKQIFIQTKFTSFSGQDPNNIPYDPKSSIQTQVRKSFQVSLANLQTNYIDSLVLHSPMKTIQKTMEVWKIFEQFFHVQKIRFLGISNCYELELFEEIYKRAKVKPSILQNRFYADSGYDKQLRQFCLQNSVKYQSFWTLTANPHILASKEFINLSKKYKRTPAEILYRALTQINIIPLIGTTSLQHMKEDLSIFEFEVQKQDMKSIEKFFN